MQSVIDIKKENGTNTLEDKAMLIDLTIRSWTARKTDKTVSQEVALRHGAQANVGRYNKDLMSGNALDSIKTAERAARKFHKDNSLPWSDNGARILPSANFYKYSEGMRKLRGRFEIAVDDFVASYVMYVNDARQSLGGLFNDSDYPDHSEIAENFGFKVVITPMPNAADFRVSLRAEDTAVIKADIEKMAQAAQAEAMQELWTRLYSAVARVAERLGDPEKKFKKGTIEKMVEVCNMLPSLNFTDDPKLEEMRREVEARLCKWSAEQLRDNTFARARTAHEAESILSVMDGYMGGCCK